MKKIIPFVLLAFCWQLSFAQKPVIKVVQSKVVVERTVIKRMGIKYQLYSWGMYGTCSGNLMLDDTSGETIDGTADLVLYIKNQYSGYDFYKSVNNTIPAGLGLNQPVKFIDSFFVFQENFSIAKISSGTTTKRYPTLDDVRLLKFTCSNGTVLYRNRDDMENATPIERITRTDTYDLFPVGTYYEGTSMSGDNIEVVTKVTVTPNLDGAYSLPTHDKVPIKGVINNNPTTTSFTGLWQYTTVPNPQANDFVNIPMQPSGSDKSLINLSAVDLFGDPGYKNYINKTIFIRFVENGVASDYLPFNVKLSSPHILNAEKTNVTCYDESNGSMKIQFDRPLLQGEKLNILLYDTVNKLNYAKYNLQELDATNSYTWKNELKSGTYYISLVGKYATGNLPYDLYVDHRDISIPRYEALNSVNFTDGFNSPQGDNFETSANYSQYAGVTYTGSLQHTLNPFPVITQPSKINVAVKVDSNIICKGSPAGVITIAASGGYVFPGYKRYYKYSLKKEGDPAYSEFKNFENSTPGWVNLSNPVFNSSEGIIQKVRYLTAGKYLLRLRDSTGCFVKDSAGHEMTYPFVITEPARGLTVDGVQTEPITSVDSSNGKFKLYISGGYQFNSGEAFSVPYQVIVEDTVTKEQTIIPRTMPFVTVNGNVYTGTKVDTTMLFTGENIKEGVYRIIVRDAYYSIVDSPGNYGCYKEVILTFKKPQPLLVSIEKRKGVSCTGDKDATLRAVATGGIRFDTKAYNYKWYRLTSEGETELFTVAGDVQVTDSIISHIGAGRYKVLVTDKYENAASATYELINPQPLQVRLSSTPAKCYSNRDGSMQVDSIWGGTPFTDPSRQSYRFEWSNSSLKQYVDSVAGGKYILYASDSLGCYTFDSVEVSSPVRIIVTANTTPASCYNSADGAIGLSVTGGMPPYTYNWSTGATTNTISNLKPGVYKYNVTDFNGVCHEIDSITIPSPDTIVVDLGPDRLLCINQTLRLDATVKNVTDPLTYSWSGSNNFTATGPKVSLINSGTYVLSVSNTTGCTLKDTIQISNLSASVNTDFIVSSQAYRNENVKLISLSSPYPHDSVKWMIPQVGNTIRIISQNDRGCDLVFSDTGRYEIGLRVYYKSGCIDDTIKTVNVIDRDPFGNVGNQANAYLKNATITSNPNNGNFKLTLAFSETTRVKVKLINILTNVVADQREVQIPNTSDYEIHYTLKGQIIAGTYLLVVETPKGSFVFKVVVVY